VFAKGLARHPSERLASWAGRRTSDLPADQSPEMVHRDDMVLLV
jgi:glutamate 5-kinase